MKFLDISTETQSATVQLDTTELTILSNALYQSKYDMVDDRTYHKLYGNIIMARNLASYGHIDDFAFTRMATQRRYIKKIDKKG